jgi:aspartyl-tRNA(Asn)/glutamyl-tRNA(Gln) amidotransferase subunit C
MFSQDDLRNLLDLSRLSIPESQVEPLSHQIEEILAYFDRLSRIDTGGVDVDFGEAVPAEAKRDDASSPGLEPEEIESCSNSFADGFFHVPLILGDDHG